MGNHFEMIPADSFTQSDYQRKYGCGDTKSRVELKALVTEGKLMKTTVNYVYYTPVDTMKTDAPAVDRGRRRRRVRPVL
jgi:hypothetical protein